MPFVHPERRLNQDGALNAYEDELPVLYSAGVRAIVSLLNIPTDAAIYTSAPSLLKCAVVLLRLTRSQPYPYGTVSTTFARPPAGAAKQPGTPRIGQDAVRPIPAHRAKAHHRDIQTPHSEIGCSAYVLYLCATSEEKVHFSELESRPHFSSFSARNGSPRNSTEFDEIPVVSLYY